VTRVHPKTIAIMQEISIDISWHQSKVIDEFYGLGIKTVFTVL
jgi:protein-tyrosine-phosphatase